MTNNPLRSIVDMIDRHMNQRFYDDAQKRAEIAGFARPAAVQADETHDWTPPVDRSFVDAFPTMGDPSAPEAYSWGPDIGWITGDLLANAVTDDDLPGMWSTTDFEGGDPDERSYAERGWIANNLEVDWADPEPRKFEFFGITNAAIRLEIGRVNRDIIDLLTGQWSLPLCHQELDPKGTE